MNAWRSLKLASAMSAICLSSVFGQEATAPRERGSAPHLTLFQDVRIFNGSGGSLSGPRNVLVKGNHIERISSEPVLFTVEDPA